MTELSQENPDQHQITELENPSAEILKILEEFVISDEYKLELKEEKYNILHNNNENIFLNISKDNLLTFFFWAGFLFLVILSVMPVLDINRVIIEYVRFIAIFLLSCLLLPIVWNKIRDFTNYVKNIKNVSKNAISKARQYEITSYYRVIRMLGNKFNLESLNKEEVRFKAIINQRKDNKGLSSKLIPLFATLSVILIVYVIGLPDYNQKTNLLYGVFSVTGVIGIITIWLNIDLELWSKDLVIYEQCILILQKAQNIAKDMEIKEKKSLINKNIKGKNLFKELKKIKIVDAPRNSSTNFDSYINREESAGTDIH